MIRIAVIDVGNRHVIIESIARHPDIELVGSIVSVAPTQEQNELKSFYESINCPIVDFGDLKQLGVDFLLVINCPKILDVSLLEGVNALNLHGGILPKYRGFSSNAWAVINGEKEVGYSLHKLDEHMDSGDIYKIYKQPIGDDEHYGEVRQRLEQMVCDELPHTLMLIKNNMLVPSSQDGHRSCYVTKLRKEDGILDWNNETEYIFGIYRTMARPYGTGVFFSHKDRLYEIVKMKKLQGVDKYLCITGAVVAQKGNAILVKTKDTVVQIDEIKLEDEFIIPSEHFKIGTRL